MTNENMATSGPVCPRTATPGMGEARARSPRLGWRNAGLSLALAAALSFAGGVSEATVTLLDNTNAGTASLAAKNGLTTRPNRYFAYSFSTTLNYTLDTLTIGAFSFNGNADARTGTVSLYNSSGGLPTGTPLAQTSAAITALGTPQYFSFSLPSSFAITAGNTYALSFAVDGATGDNNFRWSETDSEAIPTGSNGVTFVRSLDAGSSSRYAAETTDGTTWTASLGGNRPTMFLEAAAVPEPSTWMLAGIAIAGGLTYRRHRRRKGAAIAGDRRASA